MHGGRVGQGIEVAALHLKGVEMQKPQSGDQDPKRPPEHDPEPPHKAPPEHIPEPPQEAPPETQPEPPPTKPTLE